MVQLGIICLVVLAVYFVLEKKKERQRQTQEQTQEQTQDNFNPQEQFNWKYEKAPLLTPINMFIGFCGVVVIFKISEVIILSFS